MPVVVGIIHEGTLISGTGTTLNEATVELEKALCTDEVRILISAALDGINKRVTEAVLPAGRPRPPGAADSALSGGTVRDGGVEVEDAPVEGAAADAGGVAGAGPSPLPDEREQAHQADQGGGEVQVCEVCAVAVKPARAELSLEIHGQVRCAAHTGG